MDNVNNRLLVVDVGLAAILAVDLNTGNRSVISDSNMPGLSNAFNAPFGLVLDSVNDRIFVLDSAAVLVVDLVSGERVYLSR